MNKHSPQCLVTEAVDIQDVQNNFGPEGIQSRLEIKPVFVENTCLLLLHTENKKSDKQTAHYFALACAASLADTSSSDKGR